MKSIIFTSLLLPLALAAPQQQPDGFATSCGGGGAGYVCRQSAAGWNSAAAQYLGNAFGSQWVGVTAQNTGPGAIGAIATGIAALPSDQRAGASSVLIQAASLQGVAIPAVTGAASGAPASGSASGSPSGSRSGATPVMTSGSGAANATVPVAGSGSGAAQPTGNSGSAGAAGASSSRNAAAPGQTNAVFAAGFVAGVAGLAFAL